MGFFRKSKKEQLEKAYKKKLEEAFKMSHINRSKSDQLTKEAEEILKDLELEQSNN